MCVSGGGGDGWVGGGQSILQQQRTPYKTRWKLNLHRLLCIFSFQPVLYGDDRDESLASNKEKKKRPKRWKHEGKQGRKIGKDNKRQLECNKVEIAIQKKQMKPRDKRETTIDWK